jgi:peptidoglycan/xylan/chitin deacetylase (PgdA/CDA1 family)
MTQIVPILMYHHVSRQRPSGFAKYTVHPDALRSQLAWLDRLGYHTIGLDQLVAARSGGPALPPMPIALTFDDGFAEAIELALPLLLETGSQATFFLVAGLLGGESDWLERERGISLPLVDAAGVRALTAHGFRVGSHSRTHPHLPRLMPDDIERELAESRLQLEDASGMPVRHLAYPHGGHDTIVRRMALENGYETACGTEQGFVGPASDPYALPRIIVDGRDRLVDFACRLRTAERLRDLARRGPLGLARRVVAGPAAVVR